MKPIVQKDGFGCGVACVAFVAGISYAQALTFFDAGPAKTKGFACRELVTGLRKLGQDYEYKYLKPHLLPKIHNEGVIVFIKRSAEYPPGHFLAKSKEGWMDPWINWTEDSNLANAKAGFRRELPGHPIYGIFPKAVLDS